MEDGFRFGLAKTVAAGTRKTPKEVKTASPNSGTWRHVIGWNSVLGIFPTKAWGQFVSFTTPFRILLSDSKSFSVAAYRSLWSTRFLIEAVVPFP